MNLLIYCYFILCKILEEGSHDALTILSAFGCYVRHFGFEFLECRKNRKCYF